MLALQVSKIKFQIVKSSRGRPASECPPPVAEVAKVVTAQCLHARYGEHEGALGIVRYENDGTKFAVVDMDKVILKDTTLFLPETREAWKQEVLADIMGVPKTVMGILFTTSELDLRRLFSITTRTRVSWNVDSVHFNAIEVKVEVLKAMGFPARLLADLQKAGICK